jgi:protein tyrosine phosphatase
MKIEKYNVECFEEKIDLNNWKRDNKFDQTPIYEGQLYDIPQEVRSLFNNNIIVSIKKINFNDIKFILIYE